ncbi:MAG: hypothetical protein HY558_03215 [Euryarchaeota archaeon]|nr:hypothetical protein [Euryarchaeota archaeon]
MKTCILCKGTLKAHREVSEGHEIRGWKCAKCGETFFPSREMVRWEVLTGRRKGQVRKARTIGKSLVVTLPEKLAREEGIHADDLILFEKDERGLRLRVVHPE